MKSYLLTLMIFNPACGELVTGRIKGVEGKVLRWLIAFSCLLQHFRKVEDELNVGKRKD